MFSESEVIWFLSKFSFELGNHSLFQIFCRISHSYHKKEQNICDILSKYVRIDNEYDKKRQTQRKSNVQLQWVTPNQNIWNKQIILDFLSKYWFFTKFQNLRIIWILMKFKIFLAQQVNSTLYQIFLFLYFHLFGCSVPWNY